MWCNNEGKSEETEEGKTEMMEDGRKNEVGLILLESLFTTYSFCSVDDQSSRRTGHRELSELFGGYFDVLPMDLQFVSGIPRGFVFEPVNPSSFNMLYCPRYVESL